MLYAMYLVLIMYAVIYGNLCFKQLDVFKINLLLSLDVIKCFKEAVSLLGIFIENIYKFTELLRKNIGRKWICNVPTISDKYDMGRGGSQNNAKVCSSK